jgi:hypothetical protein
LGSLIQWSICRNYSFDDFDDFDVRNGETAKGSLRVKEEMDFFFGDDPLFWTDILKGYGEAAKRQYQESTSLQ